MGWKTLKETFGIADHIVCVTEQGVCIGSVFVHNLIVVDPLTGVCNEPGGIKGLLAAKYPALANAAPEEVLACLKAQDTFSASIPVYTTENDQVVVKHCETPGWPNVTHDGLLMHKNVFSHDRSKVVAWLKTELQRDANQLALSIAMKSGDIDADNQLLDSKRAKLAALEAEYPEIEPAI
jgi:hypothetical protein|tara:strand:+ start:12567 stop:13106 length:540 start_codon:yes stop_codon:yes gene_type:complete